MADYSSWLLTAIGIGLIIIGGLALGYSARILITSGRDVDSLNPMSMPMLVALSAVSVRTPYWSPPRGWTLFVAVLIFGMAAGLLGFANMVLRDWALSVISVLLAASLVVQRWYQGWQALIALVILGLIVSVVFSLMRSVSVRRERVGMGMLGAIEIVDFLVSPFGLSFIEYTSDKSAWISMLAAFLLGVGAVLQPRLVIGLGVLGVAVSSLMFSLMLGIGRQLGERHLPQPDWSGWITFAGCLVGMSFAWGAWQGVQRIRLRSAL